MHAGDPKYETVGGLLYPMSKKEQTLEHIREKAQLRPRAGLHAVATRVRYTMAYTIHNSITIIDYYTFIPTLLLVQIVKVLVSNLK